MSDSTITRADRLSEAAALIRRGFDDRPVPPDFYALSGRPMCSDASVAELLEVEAQVRRTQPRGFYEIEAADGVADALLGTAPVEASRG